MFHLEMLEDDFGAMEISEQDNVMDLIGDSMSKVRFMFKVFLLLHSLLFIYA